jgi:glycerol-3-phosphate cytidylyltransferase-like family protein
MFCILSIGVCVCVFVWGVFCDDYDYISFTSRHHTYICFSNRITLRRCVCGCFLLGLCCQCTDGCGFIGYVFRFGKSFQLVIIIRSNQTLHHAGKIQHSICLAFHNSVCVDSDVFATAKKAGRFKTVKRTEGVSTTEIVGRMLLMTKSHFRRDEASDLSASPSSSSLSPPPLTRSSSFLPTARRINQFSSGRTPKPSDKVVYIDGAWDMFHAGHIVSSNMPSSMNASSQIINEINGA